MARYLLVERRRRNALDPVANFHLCNGAEVWRINWKVCPGRRSCSWGEEISDILRYIPASVFSEGSVR